MRRIGIAKHYLQKIELQLKLLYPKRKEQELLQQYISFKFMQLLLVLSAVVVLAFVYIAAENGEDRLWELHRQNYWGEKEYKEIEVQADSLTDTLEIAITNQQMSAEEETECLKKAAGQLPQLILGTNLSLNQVTSNLNLISTIPETQIAVFWQIEENDVLTDEGFIKEENLNKEGTKVQLTAFLSGIKSNYETKIDVVVFEPEWTEEEQLKKKILKAIKAADADTLSQESLRLPEEVDGAKIVYRHPSEKNNLGLAIGLLLIVLPLAFFSQDEKLGRKREKREMQMILDYPEIVNKLTLYMGAGMTVRSSFEKIASDYLQRKKQNKTLVRWGYEEILHVCREMQGGIGERKSLEHMSERCSLRIYRKLSVMLLQNVKKGSRELTILLQKEALCAFEERKNMAKKIGEEAGSKLLLPMILMLCIVLGILIVPALMTFQI